MQSSPHSQIWGLLNRRERRFAVLALGGMLAVALSEVAGVASVMPFLTVLSDANAFASNPSLSWLHARLGYPVHERFVIQLGSGFLVFLMLSLIVRGASVWGLTRFAQGRSVALSSELLSGSLGQPYLWFVNRNSTRLATMVHSDSESVVNDGLLPLLQIVSQSLVVTLLVGLLIAVNPTLALALGALVGGGFLLSAWISRDRLRAISGDRYAAYLSRIKLVQEGFQAFREVRLLALEKHLLEVFRRHSQTRARLLVRANMLSILPALVMQALVFGGLVAVLLFLVSAQGSLQAAIPTAGLYAMAGYRLLPAIQRIFEENTKLRVSSKLISEVHDAVQELRSVPPKTDSSAVALTPLAEGADVDFANVSFSYPGNESPAIQDLSLSIPFGTSLGIVGSSGAGKSTMLDLLLGLIDPDTGSVLTNGIPLSDSDQRRRWQRSVGYVPQQIFLSDDTLAANIAFGESGSTIDLDRVKVAAQRACLDDFVRAELRDGYQTMVGDRGLRLSGGQRQRVGLARALYHQPSILILDEATSALDNLTERRIIDQLLELSGKTTLIMIAHRLSTVQQCDRIAVMEGGRLVGLGGYDWLLEASESFRRLALVT